MKFYIDENNNYIGGWDQNPPNDLIEVPFPPNDARQKWDGEKWENLLITKEVIADRRYKAEIGGMNIDGMTIATDDRSKLLINGAAFESILNPEYVMQWKTENGFIELSGEQVIFIARTVRAHVQACFDREAELLLHLENNTLTEEMLEEGWPNELLHRMA